jgi:hypothetical protein
MSYPNAPAPGYSPTPPANHPRAVLGLVLGIVGVAICYFTGPFAYVISNKAMKEIDASGGTIGGRGMVQAGKILGIIGTILLVLGVIIGVIGLAVSFASSNG